VNGSIKMAFVGATGMALAVALGVGLATTGWAAQVERVQQDPAVHGNLNKCWGKVASQTAKLGRDDDIPGGGLGSHSRSTQAANNVGGFANSDNGFGIQFNVDGGRKGVGNFSAQTAETGGPITRLRAMAAMACTRSTMPPPRIRSIRSMDNSRRRLAELPKSWTSDASRRSPSRKALSII
jgi:hypothetical protein